MNELNHDKLAKKNRRLSIDGQLIGHVQMAKGFPLNGTSNAFTAIDGATKTAVSSTGELEGDKDLVNALYFRNFVGCCNCIVAIEAN